MKFKPDKKYIVWGITAFLVSVCVILFIFAVFNYPVFAKGFSNIIRILMPVIDGFLIAYLLNPVMMFYEEIVIPCVYGLFSHKKPEGVRTKRVFRYISIILSLLSLALVIMLFISIVVPQLIESITSIALQFPQYANNVVAFVNKTFDDYPQVLDYFYTYYDRFEEWAGGFMKDLPSYANRVWSSVSRGIVNSVSFVWNIILGLVLSVYILSFKEKFTAQMRKITLAYFNRRKANDIFDGLREINFIFRNYIVSSIVDSLIIGMLCFILCLILGFPYPILISFIVGLTNIIPFFGPFIGAVPGTLIIFMISPIRAFYFILMILILQQMDGNVIKPRLFGSSTGLPAFWVVVAILVGGGLFGVMGMYLGTPVFAVLYNTVRRRVARRLEMKGLPSDTLKYVRSDELPYEIPESERREEESRAQQIIEKIKDRIEDRIENLNPDDDQKQ